MTGFSATGRIWRSKRVTDGFRREKPVRPIGKVRDTPELVPGKLCIVHRLLCIGLPDSII